MFYLCEGYSFDYGYRSDIDWKDLPLLRVNRIIVPFEYAHLSPIFPLVDGRYHIIARKDSDQPEFNLFLSDNYSIDIGDQDVPRLTGEVICSIGKQY